MTPEEIKAKISGTSYFCYGCRIYHNKEYLPPTKWPRPYCEASDKKLKTEGTTKIRVPK
jgi:hypothetical protein